MDILTGLFVLLVICFLTYRAIIFLFTHAITVFILIGAMIVGLIVLADEDMLPKFSPSQTTISQN